MREKSSVVTVRIEDNLLESIKHYSRMQGGYEKRQIGYGEMIRRACLSVYPILPAHEIDKASTACSGILYGK